MIHIEIVGAGGWLSVVMWLGMAIGVPIYCYRMGKLVANDARDQAEHEAFMAKHRDPS